MLLTIETTHKPATDLGFLLHKNPARAQRIELPFGSVEMFYAHADEALCTFHLLLDLDPVRLVRGGGGKEGGLIDQYVNDRPYTVSSFMSVAIGKALRSALNARSAERPELAEAVIPLTISLTPLQVRGDAGLVERLFLPLGYRVTMTGIPLDPAFPEWGHSNYVSLKLEGTLRLADALNHIYVLIPVLDLYKHYYIDADEIEKLLQRGGAWLQTHPEREAIVRRYLKRRRALANAALERLIASGEAAPVSEAGVDGEDAPPADDAGQDAKPRDRAEEALEKPLRLHDVRLDAVAAVLKDAGVRKVADLGCGSGKLLKRLLAERQFIQILGVDVGVRDLEAASRRLRLDTLSERERGRISLAQGALTYRDKRLDGFDAIALVEVIEHIDPDRLAAVERVVFEFARPGMVVLTTPNRDYNAKFAALPAGQFRHPDHRFEWTRAEFASWAESVAQRFRYTVRFLPLGEVDAVLGAPSQMAVFERAAS